MKFLKTTLVLLVLCLLTPPVSAKNYITSVFLELNNGSPITTTQNIRLSLWSDGRQDGGDIDGIGAINIGATNYANFSTELTITPDNLGRLKIALTILPNFPQIEPSNQFLMIEYKDDGAPDTSYTIFNDLYIDSTTLDRFPLIENGPDIFEAMYNNNATDADQFILDQDNSAINGTIDLQFGNSLNKFLQYDIDNTRFVFTDDVRIEGNTAIIGQTFIADNHAATDSDAIINIGRNENAWETLTFDSTTDDQFELSDDLNVEGNVDQDGDTLTLDADNTAAGSDVSIVANQGSDTDGTIRYNATENRWEISNDGDTFQPLASDVAQVYESGTTTFNAATPIEWDGTSTTFRIVDSAYTHSTGTNPSRVTVVTSGLYEVNYNISWDTTENSRRTATCSFYVNGVSVNPTVGTTHSYTRNNNDDTTTNAATFLYSFSGGEYYEIYCQSTGTPGNIVTLANQSSTMIKRIR